MLLVGLCTGCGTWTYGSDLHGLMTMVEGVTSAHSDRHQTTNYTQTDKKPAM